MAVKWIERRRAAKAKQRACTNHLWELIPGTIIQRAYQCRRCCKVVGHRAATKGA